MRQTLLPIVLSAALCPLLLVACAVDRSPAANDTEATAPARADSSDITPVDAMPAEESPSSPEPGEGGDSPVSNTADGSDAQARFDGYGDVRLGIAAADMQTAWGGDLKAVGKDANETCYFLTPAWVKAPAEFAFMIENGKFVRYGTESPTFGAPGGGKVGMATSEIQALYQGRIQEQPHKYTDGKYLRIKDAASDNALLFETDAAGKVSEWRVGVPPQVDYVEGCS